MQLIFNYKNTITKINNGDTSTYGSSKCLCKSANSSYLNHHTGEIITVDLQIIKNKFFCKVLSEDPNCKEPNIINWKKVKKVSWMAQKISLRENFKLIKMNLWHL